MARLKIKEIRTAADLETMCASLEVTAEALKEEGVYLLASLLSPDLEEADRILPMEAEREMEFRMQAPSAQLWDTERARLYRLHLELFREPEEVLEEKDVLVGFYKKEIRGGEYFLNGEKVPLRAVRLPQGPAAKEAGEDIEGRRTWMRGMRRAQYNAVILKEADPELVRLCLEYGLYPITDGEEAPEEAPPLPEHQSPDYDLTVTSGGVLIENHSVFTNASEYLLKYQMLYEGEPTGCAGGLKADVPPGTGQYVELPFSEPAKAGRYTYRTALCYRKKTFWAEEGEEVISAELAMSSLFLGEAGPKEDKEQSGFGARTETGQKEEDSAEEETGTAGIPLL